MENQSELYAKLAECESACCTQIERVADMGQGSLSKLSVIAKDSGGNPNVERRVGESAIEIAYKAPSAIEDCIRDTMGYMLDLVASNKKLEQLGELNVIKNLLIEKMKTLGTCLIESLVRCRDDLMSNLTTVNKYISCLYQSLVSGDNLESVLHEAGFSLPKDKDTANFKERLADNISKLCMGAALASSETLNSIMPSVSDAFGIHIQSELINIIENSAPNPELSDSTLKLNRFYSHYTKLISAVAESRLLNLPSEIKEHMNKEADLMGALSANCAALKIIEVNLVIEESKVQPAEKRMEQLESSVKDIKVRLNDYEYSRKTLEDNISGKSLFAQIVDRGKIKAFDFLIDGAKAKIDVFEEKIQTIKDDFLNEKHKTTIDSLNSVKDSLKGNIEHIKEKIKHSREPRKPVELE